MLGRDWVITLTSPSLQVDPDQIRKWAMMNADLGPGWMALISAYNLVVPGVASQAKRHAKFTYKLLGWEDEPFEAAY